MLHSLFLFPCTLFNFQERCFLWVCFLSDKLFHTVFSQLLEIIRKLLWFLRILINSEISKGNFLKPSYENISNIDILLSIDYLPCIPSNHCAIIHTNLFRASQQPFVIFRACHFEHFSKLTIASHSTDEMNSCDRD